MSVLSPAAVTPSSRRRRGPAALAAALTTVLAAVCIAVGAAPAGAAPAARDTPETGKHRVDDARMTWAINDESGSGAFFGGCNFLVAGTVRDPGSSRVWSKADGFYQATSGAVRLEKPLADGSVVTPTWETKCQNPSGGTVTTGNNTHTDIRLAFGAGTGWVDPDTGEASVSWQGSFTVVYYGGLSFWSASNPVLKVDAKGTGTLTATGSGFGADMDDPEKWTVLVPRSVTLATMKGITVGDTGFTATPDYRGVAVNVPANGAFVPQSPQSAPNKAYWGSFPQDFVNFQMDTGQAAYWYTSGGQRDPAKPALPIGVGYTLGEIIEVTEPTTPATSTSTVTVDRPTTRTVVTTATDTVRVTASPTGGPASPVVEKPFTVKDATLRWGVNNEANNRAFAPGTVNLFSAGKIPSQGAAQKITPTQWKATAGAVTIEKLGTDGSYRTATWAGLSTTADGTELGSPSAGTFSGHQVVVRDGTGTIDPIANTATVSWKGDFTVALYSGLTFFYVSDPVLTVRSNGTARLTATLGGYGADMADLTRWEKLPDAKGVVLADLKDVRVGSDGGFTVTPAYAGVKYQAKGSATTQKRDTPYFGSFPASFVDYQQRTGQASYWYSSGGASDKYKAALPLSVVYTGPLGSVPSSTPTAPEGSTAGGAVPTTSPPAVRNTVNPPPPRPTGAGGANPPVVRSAPAATRPAAPTTKSAAAVPPTVQAAGPAAALPMAAYAMVNAAQGLTALAPTTLPVPPVGPEIVLATSFTSADRVLWISGSVALLFAALLGLYAAGFRLNRRS
ncbi:hypothetical protein D1871_09880 [Nakamurella silvestris]|nr:hypothetical protein D1871_09880 [Nakamurella silvestris]